MNENLACGNSNIPSQPKESPILDQVLNAIENECQEIFFTKVRIEDRLNRIHDTRNPDCAKDASPETPPRDYLMRLERIASYLISLRGDLVGVDKKLTQLL